jgi:hypothetical protein
VTPAVKLRGRALRRTAGSAKRLVTRSTLFTSAVIVASLVTLGGAAFAQDSREAVIAAAEADKAAHPPKEHKNKAEQGVDRISAFLTPKPRGPYPYFGGVYPGGGVTLGAGYGWAVGDQASLAVHGLYTIRNYKLVETVWLSPGHLDGRLQFTGKTGWRNATEAPYYGRGMQTTPADRTEFNFREGYAESSAQLFFTHWIVASGAVALETYTVDRGQGEAPSPEDVFTPETAPGLGANPTYVHTQGTAAIDWRTSPGYSRTGGYYGVTLHNYRDTSGPFDFNRLDGEVIQHMPILRETWVISMRGRVQTTLGGSNTPFFLLPSLGSGTTLRAYRSLRYRDTNSLLTQAEFRWVPSRVGMDMAIFVDAGKVTSRREDLDLTGLAHDWGFGVRLHGPTITPLRIEMAHGSEGWKFVFGGSPVF